MEWTIYLSFLYLDPRYYLILGPAILFALYAQLKVQGAYRSMSRVSTMRGYSGAEAADRILGSAGITDVKIEQVKGWLSDHYDPREKVLRLSPGVYEGRSIASVGIAAHESGHALQHAEGYAPLNLRSMLVPVAGIGSWLAWPMILIGYGMRNMGLAHAGLLLFLVLVLFQAVTLPVEFNASSRAKRLLTGTGIVKEQKEIDGISNVLNAAALTYVAATVTAVAQLLYFLLRVGALGGNRK